MSPEGLTRTTALSNRPPRAPSCRAIREGARPQASIGKGVAPDEVVPPDLDAIDAEIARRDIDQPPQREGGFRAAGAAIGVGRHGVRKNHLYLAVDRRGGIDAGEQRSIEVGRNVGTKRRNIGAEAALLK